MSKLTNRNIKGGKLALNSTLNQNQFLPMNKSLDKSSDKLNKLLNNYKNKPSLSSLNNYAKILSVGFTSFIKDGKITLLNRYMSFLQKEGKISFKDSVSKLNTSIGEINDYSKKEFGSNATLGDASKLFGSSMENSKELFIEYSSVIRFAWELSGDEDFESLLPSKNQHGGDDNSIILRTPVRRNRLLALMYIMMFVFSIFAIYQQITSLTNTISDLYTEYGNNDTTENIFTLTVALQVVQDMFTGAFIATLTGFSDIAMTRMQMSAERTYISAQVATQQTWDRSITSGITGFFTGASQQEVTNVVLENAQHEQRRMIEDATRAINNRFRDVRADISIRWTTLIIGLHMLPTSTILMLNWVNNRYVSNETAMLTMGALSSAIQNQGLFAMGALFTNYTIVGGAIYRSVRGIPDPLTLRNQTGPHNEEYVFDQSEQMRFQQTIDDAIRNDEPLLQITDHTHDELGVAQTLANMGRKGGKKSKKKSKKSKKSTKKKSTKKTKKKSKKSKKSTKKTKRKSKKSNKKKIKKSKK